MYSIASGRNGVRYCPLKGVPIKDLPTYLLEHLPPCLFPCLPPYLHTYHPPTFLPVCLYLVINPLFCLPAYQLAYIRPCHLACFTAYLLFFLPPCHSCTHRLTSLPPYLLIYLPIYLLSCSPACLPACLVTYLPLTPYLRTYNQHHGCWYASTSYPASYLRARQEPAFLPTHPRLPTTQHIRQVRTT